MATFQVPDDPLYKDAVTGLPNRTLFQASLDEKVAHARNAGEGLSVLLIDMDNFKHVNDTLGHPAGDRALAGFARRIAAVMPTAATIVRFGGDEFSVILPGIDADTASIIAGYLGQLVTSIALLHAVDRIAIGGGVMADGSLLPLMRHAAHRPRGGDLQSLRDLAQVETFLTRPALGDGAAIAGAMLQAQDLPPPSNDASLVRSVRTPSSTPAR
jgi:diguanylate cyclase (GGDEF)-like protein